MTSAEIIYYCAWLFVWAAGYVAYSSDVKGNIWLFRVKYAIFGFAGWALIAVIVR